MKKYTIEIDHELKIIRYKHSGEIIGADIGEAWKEFLNMREFVELKYNLLSDYRNAKFNENFAFANWVVNFMINIKDIVAGKKQALVVDDPYSTALSVLFVDEVKQKVGFIVEVFSTKEAALTWLKK